MSSNGLFASRWAVSEVGAAASAPISAPAAAAVPSPDTSNWVGLEASQWAQPEPASEAEEEEDDQIWVATDDADIIFVMSVMLAAIFDLEGNAEAREEKLNVKELLLADEQLLDELTLYLESFSPQARDIAFDQLDTYLGRALEDLIVEGTEYDGRYARECGLWMERLRQKDLKGEFDEFEPAKWSRTLESLYE